MKKIYACCLILFFSCSKEEIKNPIVFALNADSEKIQAVMKNLEAHEVQIMVTDATGKDFKFQVNDSSYFYPASSVKFPIALLALEKAQRIPEIDSQTVFQIEGDSIKTTIQQEVKKIFAVSDNEAYNRLFEFLGQDEIQQSLIAKNLQPARISHRVGTQNADTIVSKKITFFENDSIVFQQEAKSNQAIEKLSLFKMQKGVGFYRDDSFVSKPMDFSEKNYVPIGTLHELMKRVQFPEKDTEKEQFQILESDRDFLLNVMHETPKQQGFTETEYYDSYVNFLCLEIRKKQYLRI